MLLSERADVSSTSCCEQYFRLRRREALMDSRQPTQDVTNQGAQAMSLHPTISQHHVCTRLRGKGNDQTWLVVGPVSNSAEVDPLHFTFAVEVCASNTLD